MTDDNFTENKENHNIKFLEYDKIKKCSEVECIYYF